VPKSAFSLGHQLPSKRIELIKKRMRSEKLRRIITLAASIALLGLSGCSGRNPLLSYGPHPRAEDCAQIQQATPTKYICDGKPYTSVQLSDIRNGQSVASK
jgi:hypothetical protein